MLKNNIKILAIVLAILLICSGIVYIITSNKSLAYTSDAIKDFQNMSVEIFAITNKYYCLNKGLDYAPGYYVKMGEGQLPPTVAYAIGYEQNERGEGKTHYNNDAVANIVWETMGSFHNGQTIYYSDDYYKIINRANIIQNINENSVNIDIPNVMVVENAQGEYGPFTIDYPNINGELVGNSCKIIVNGTTVIDVKDLIKKEDGYYFTAAQGINKGQKNTIEIVYNASNYTGTYTRYKREMGIYRLTECLDCHATATFTIQGILNNGQIETRDGNRWYGEFEHGTIRINDANGVLVRYEDCPKTSGFSYQYRYENDYQDIIEPVITPIPVDKNDNVEFWAGKPNIEIDFNKINTEGKNVEGASFGIDVVGGQVEGSQTITTSASGNKIKIKPNDGATSVTVILTEIEAPEEYALLEEPIVIQYNWDSNNQKWICATNSFAFASGEKVEIGQITSTRNENSCVDSHTIKAENRRKITVNLIKTDSALNLLPDMTFGINVSGGECETNTITTDANGKAEITIIPAGTGDVTLTLTEQSNPYYMDLKPVVITFTYREGRWQPTIDASLREQVAISGEIAVFDLDIKNKAKIENLILTKVNTSVFGEVIPGIEFRIKLDNAKTLTGVQYISATTDAKGQIILGTLEVINPNLPIKITLEEIGGPDDGLNYKGFSKAIIELRHKQKDYEVKSDYITAKYENNTIYAEIKNDVTMDLSGMVWLDEQTGIKPVQPPNGKKDSGEEGVAGVSIRLVGPNGTETTITESNGMYKFENLPASVNPNNKDFQYYIEFTYDGINYIRTLNGDSDAAESNRAEFNEKFKTITKETIAESEYLYINNEAILQTTSDGVVKEKYAMKATTLPVTYNKNTEDIDLGLVKKEVDLAAVTDILTATVKINGEEITYKYNELKKDADGNLILTNDEQQPNYNLFLYDSDYYYRIKDYKLEDATHKDKLTVAQNEDYGSKLYDQRKDKELSVDVTYQILLNNQSATAATINQIAYYYDTKYEPRSNATVVEVNGTSYYKEVFDINQQFGNTINQAGLPITLTVGKDSNGNLNTGVFKNWVEITSYSTDNSCVDKDSAPDNFTSGKVEDDTDDAGGIKVQINGIHREVSGYVFKDKKDDTTPNHTGNGECDNDEEKVNDVIVQLIEIKDVDINGKKISLEYIWQETVSGKDWVKVLSNKGDSVINRKYTDDINLNDQTVVENGTTYKYKYVNEMPNDGEYLFTDFIPGNYIVRFIYGDGTYYDTDSAGNIRKYNGQDYKSTIDTQYSSLEHNEQEKYKSNSSMARDNEARRLEVMDYAIGQTDPSTLIIDKKEELEKTWMCAETSRIDMSVSKANQGDETDAISQTINFGLVERPKAHLVLEKHVTGLKLDNVFEAHTNLNNYKEKVFNITTDNNDNILVEPTEKETEKGKRGSWKIDIDINQIQGNKLYITYGYRVKNIGDPDYYTEALRNANGNYSNIAKAINTQSDSEYTIGKYLGHAYYSGDKSDNDIEAVVPFQIEDYISDGLNLDTINSEFNEEGKETKKVWKYKNTTSDEKPADEVEEEFTVVRTGTYAVKADEETTDIIELKVNAGTLGHSTDGELTYRSCAAQLVYPTGGQITSDTGMLCKKENLTFRNLDKVQSYVEENSVPLKDLVTEDDEFIAETVIITKNTGEDKETPVMLIISITAGLAVVAVGIILIKKYVIK